MKKIEAEKEGKENIVASQEALEIVPTVDQTQPVIEIVPNPNTAGDETCVLYMDSDELARQVRILREPLRFSIIPSFGRLLRTLKLNEIAKWYTPLRTPPPNKFVHIAAILIL